MKIVCDSCSTKYSISDDKVRGKVFKIRCKKCSHIIVVRGTGEGTPGVVEPAAAEAVWHLVVDGDQVGPLSDADVRARLSRGEITVENYLWKEGFADWLRLADVPEFADLAPVAPVAGELFSDSPTRASGGSGRHALEAVAEDAGGFFGAGAAGQEARASSKSSSGRVRAQAAAAPEDDAFSAPAAPALGGEGGDLFGIAAPLAHADSGRVRARGSNGTGAAGGAVARHDGGRVESLTAQRSENSVLFSLSNLQSLAAPSAAPKMSSHSPQGTGTEGSGLIDIRARAASPMKAPSGWGGPSTFGNDSRIAMDELPSYGAFSSAAPVLLPLSSSSGPPKWIYALVALVVVMIGAVGWATYGVLRKPVVVEQPAPPPAAAAPAPAAPAGAAQAPASKITLAEGELPPREGAEAGPGEKGGEKSAERGGSKGGHRAKGKKGEKGDKGGGSSGGDGKSASSGDSSKPSAPAASAEPAQPKAVKGSLDDLLEGALNGRKSRPRVDDDPSAGGSRKSGGDSGGGGGPLAKSAVVAGMNGVKGKIAGCYAQFKVPGLAMVNVVIGKSGKVSSATVTGKFAGTPTGGCVESAVKAASFPPSEGLTTPYPFNLR
jgi:predicted Zn finger-like uncharacterized protein